MINDGYYAAALLKQPISDAGPGDPPAKVDPSIRPEWNDFVMFLQKKGLRGNTDLDDRDKGLGQKMLSEYKKKNPGSKLTYDMVPLIQQDFQDIRQQGLNDLHTGKIKVDGLKSDDDFMADLSGTDGWLGSKTSNHLYPTALLTNTTGNTKNFGTDMEAYNKLVKNYKKQ